MRRVMEDQELHKLWNRSVTRVGKRLEESDLWQLEHSDDPRLGALGQRLQCLNRVRPRKKARGTKTEEVKVQCSFLLTRVQLQSGRMEGVLASCPCLRRSGQAVSLLASHQGEPGSLPNFRMWESCRTIPLAGGFSRGSPVCPALSFRRSSILTSVILLGSQDLAALTRILLNGVLSSGITADGQTSNDIVPNGVTPNGVTPNGSVPGGVMPKSVTPNSRLFKRHNASKRFEKRSSHNKEIEHYFDTGIEIIPGDNPFHMSVVGFKTEGLATNTISDEAPQRGIRMVSCLVTAKAISTVHYSHGVVSGDREGHLNSALFAWCRVW
ncbi:hypothetical protein PR048_003795 [Dryococelus australis]|uniref:Uncharacterized protein n=1 Tax=Dryococelus australis TaxID=614101 RepID=A0ABQ9IQ92_9NEOP|nr:hypothetical protein PR048_003795 [Dryococelus australis]